ncbi:peptidyl-alpha-hydroxyglycine alpha-amidating lyase family protein [Sphingomonas sp.]|uniref:peptidyl-alpha-hydroxyglycine alpha-amidating lyase family protein n=1 Tax=Sphingomonas sp. TaxID=28214 RepID=UPI0035AFA1A3
MDAQTDITIGEGRFRYRFRRDWARLPRWWNFGEAAEGRPPQTAVHGGVAANGDVYVLARAAHPVTVFDGDGNFITSWGEGEFSPFVHGLRIAPDGTVWITDSGNHTVKQFTPDGRKLRTLGVADSPAPTLYGNPFNMPTGVAFHPNGDMYASDGYGNRRVHRFGADGTRKESFGGPGTGPGEFAIVHFIEIDAQGRIYIADRENQRIQVFDAEGRHLADWTGFDMPSDLAFGDGMIVVGGRDGLSIWTPEREPLARWDADAPHKGAFNIHGVWLDRQDNIFLAHFDRTVSKLTRI